MIDLIRKKLQLHVPYAGAFLRKTERYISSPCCVGTIVCYKHCSEDEVVNNLDDIYNVGTFVQITEMAEQGDRLRMIIQGIRRYSQMCNALGDHNFCFRIQIVDHLRDEQFSPEGEIIQPEQLRDKHFSSEGIEPQKILMVRTKNLVHEPFESTMDVKVSNCS